MNTPSDVVEATTAFRFLLQHLRDKIGTKNSEEIVLWQIQEVHHTPGWMVYPTKLCLLRTKEQLPFEGFDTLSFTLAGLVPKHIPVKFLEVHAQSEWPPEVVEFFTTTYLTCGEALRHALARLT